MTTATKRSVFNFVSVQPYTQYSLNSNNPGIDYTGSAVTAYGYEGNRALDSDQCFIRGGKLYSGEGFLSLYSGINGTPRAIFPYQYNATQRWVMTGTTTRLYANMTNITPLQTSTTAIPNSIDTTNLSPTIVVNAALHGQAVGDRVKINGSTDVGGILAANINKEHIITATTTNTFSVNTGTNATSTVTGGGGASVEYQKQIAVTGSWSMDGFGNLLVLTPGNQTGVYKWDGNTAVAPTLITNAPTAVDYVFVHENIICTLGAGGQRNRFKTCSRGQETVWDTTAADSTAYEDDIEGAAAFVSAISMDGYVLVWSQNKCYRTEFIGTPDLWSQFIEILKSDGIAGINSKAELNAVVYWMGMSNWYMYDGAQVQALPTDDFMHQLAKSFTGSNRTGFFVGAHPYYDQVWFFYQTSGSSIPSYCAIYNYKEGTFTFSQYQFSAIMNPLQIAPNGLRQYYGHSTNEYIYVANAVTYDDNATTSTKLIYQTPFVAIGEGDKKMEIYGIELHGSSYVYDAEFTIKVIVSNDYTPSLTTETYTFTGDDVVNNFLEIRVAGRYRSYRFEYDLVNGSANRNSVFLSQVVEHIKGAPER